MAAIVHLPLADLRADVGRPLVRGRSFTAAGGLCCSNQRFLPLFKVPMFSLFLRMRSSRRAFSLSMALRFV